MREQPEGPSWEGSEAAENEWIMETRDDHALRLPLTSCGVYLGHI